MTVLIDGRCVCDGCAAVDPSTDMKLAPGWARVERPNTYSIHPDYMHLCGKCSEMRATAPAAKPTEKHCAYPGHAMKKQCKPERTLVVSPKGARFLVCDEALFYALGSQYKIGVFSKTCARCGKPAKKLFTSTWKRFDGTFATPGGICAKCKKKEDEDVGEGFKALFG